MKKSKTKFHFSNKYTLIGLTIFCIGLIVLSSVNNEIFRPVKTIIGYILVPVQKGINHTGSYLYNQVDDLRNMHDALSENEALMAQIQILTEENNRLNEQKYELNRLRELYELDQTYMEYEKVGARVIAKDSGNWFHVFRIDKGTNDGILVDMNVIADGGLVGIVVDVAPNYATVRSIIDDSSNVSAMALSNSASCIVSGDLTLFEKGLLKLDYIDKEDIILDDEKIVTSNISTKYLPGILIGYAKDVQVDDSNITQSGVLVPVVNFDYLHEVLVITELKETGNSEE